MAAGPIALYSTALAQVAVAQVAGGAQAGGGIRPVIDSDLLNAVAPEPPQCFHSHADLSVSKSNDNRLSIWLSVHQPATANIAITGGATGLPSGTLAITVLLDGLPVAKTSEVQESNPLSDKVYATVALVPGRQYKVTAKALVKDTKLSLLNMSVAVGGTCS